MTSRPDSYPLVALTPLSNFAMPPSGVILQGWGIGAVFPSSDANWLFRQHGDWIKHADERAIYSPDVLNNVVAFRVTNGAGLGIPTGSGLSVTPTGGGVYYCRGLRVDLTNASAAYVGVLQLSIPPSTTFYVHARPQPDVSGPIALSSVGELFISTNAVEAGYGQIGSGTSDATDVLSYAETATLAMVWAVPLRFNSVTAENLDVVDLLSFSHATGSGLAGFSTLTLAAAAGELALDITGSTTATAAAITGGAGQAALLVTGGNNAAIAMQVLGSGTSPGFVASGGAGASTATGIRGDAVHKDATGVHGRTSVTPSAIAAGVTGEARAAGSSGVHANGGTVGRGLLVRADTGGTPDYPAMRIIPQSADPASATQDGEVYWSSDHKTLRTCVATYGYRSIPTMGPGSALIVNATNTAADGVAGSGSYSAVITATCSTLNGTGVYGQAAGAEVAISVSFDVRQTTGGSTNTVNVGLVDMTNGGDIARWAGDDILSDSGFFLDTTGVKWHRTVVCNVRYPFPSDGDLEVKLEVGGELAPLEVRNVSLTIMGTF